MDSAILLKLLEKQKNMDEKNYLLTTIAFNAAPTLIHNKPASLTSFTKGKRNLYHIWDSYKTSVPAALGIEYVELRRTQERILVLFYRPKQLQQTLRNLQNAIFLKKQGYPNGLPVHEALTRLKSRMQSKFPHEIGIFLGYPIEDVLGFIEKKGREYLLCKYWKVYHNPDKAREYFDSYDQAKIQVVDSL